MAGTLFIVSAPSGAGKTALVEALLSRIASFYLSERSWPLIRLVRHEQGEVHGHDYYFVTQQEFEEQRDAGFFLE